MKSDIESHIAGLIKKEYDTAKSNQGGDNADFEAVIDLLECKRTEKNYEWLSDVFFPKYPAMVLTRILSMGESVFCQQGLC